MLKSTYLKAIGLALVAGVLIPSAILASTITNAEFWGRIIVSNNGTQTASYTSTVFTFNTTALIAGGYISANGSDVAIRNPDGTDTAFMPGYAGSPWVVFVPTAAGTSAQNLYLYSKNVTGGRLSYFPGAAGMNTTDNASLELGSNFTITQTGFIDTTAGANKFLTYKPDAFAISTDNGSIKAVISSNNTIYPSANGTLQEIPTLVGASYAWQAVISNDTNISYIGQTSAAVIKYSTFTTSAQNFTLAGTINSVTFHIVGFSVGGGDHYGRTAFITHNTTYNGTSNQLSNISYTDYSDVYTTNPYTGIAWTQQEIRDLEIGAGVYVSVGNDARITMVYATVSVTGALGNGVTATSVASGNHSVNTTLTSGNFSISVDGLLKDSITVSSSVPNTANAWQFCTANATPYVQEVAITINGTQQARWTWQYGTTFNSNGNIATPTFRTATSNANVTANISSFTNYQSLPIPPTSASNSSWNMFTSVPNQPENMYSELNMTFFGAGVVSQFASDTDQPISLIVFIYAFGIAILSGLIAFTITIGAGMRRRFGTERSSGHQGSLFIMSIVIFLSMMYFTLAGGGVIPGFILIPFAVKAFALMIMEKQPSII